MIGEQLLKLRIKHNMTQEEFAEYMDVSRQAVSKWELDKTLPDVYKLLKMSELFQVSVDYLLKGTEGTSALVNHDEISVSSSQEENTISENGIMISTQPEAIEQTEPETAIKSEMAIAPDAMINSETAIKPESKRRTRRIGLKVSITLVSILLAGLAVIIVHCMLCQIWDKSDSEKTLVKVDKVYKQYSLAEVSGYNEDGLSDARTVLLDTNGVRGGDYIYCYINNDTGKISVNYDISTIIMLISIVIILLLILGLLIRELKKNEKE